MDSTDDQGRAAPHVTAGDRLRSAREVAGLSRSDIASQTKIAERHLQAIEENRFGDLAARTYAVGFARAYARALGLDEAEIAALVRSQLDAEDNERPLTLPSFEPGDPARVPPVRVAWLAGGGAVIVIVMLLVFWSSFLSPEGKLPDLLPDHTQVPVAHAPAPAQRTPPAPAAGPVILTATDDNVWLAVTDGSGTKLFERTLAKGESWTVPASAQGPQLRTGRPDALRLTVGGRAVPPLADKPTTVAGISLIGADLLARINPAVPGGAGAIAPARPQQGVVATAAPKPAPSPATSQPAAPKSPPAAVPSSKPAARPPAEPAPPTAPVATPTSGSQGGTALRPASATQAVSTISE